jgi:hypothetical protein
LQLTNPAFFHAAEPIVELFSRASAEHPSELLYQLLCLIHLGMQRPQERQRFLFLR